MKRKTNTYKLIIKELEAEKIARDIFNLKIDKKNLIKIFEKDKKNRNFFETLSYNK